VIICTVLPKASAEVLGLHQARRIPQKDLAIDCQKLTPAKSQTDADAPYGQTLMMLMMCGVRAANAFLLARGCDNALRSGTLTLMRQLLEQTAADARIFAI